MEIKCKVVIITLVLLLSISCGGDSEPKEYIHTQAGFKITAPAGWQKVSEDHEMYEFRSGDLKLIEVGSFYLEIPSEDLYNLSNENIHYMLMKSTLEGLDGYCLEARIKDYKIEDQSETEWGGEYAYRVRARGYSADALDQMVVDIISMVHKEESRMYMFASQIVESEYRKTKPDIETMITSFTIIQ